MGMKKEMEKYLSSLNENLKNYDKEASEFDAETLGAFAIIKAKIDVLEYFLSMEPDQPVTAYEKYLKGKENIEELICLLIDARKEALGSSNCPYCYDNKKKPCRKKEIDCSECKDVFFEKMYDDLIEEFLIE